MADRPVMYIVINNDLKMEKGKIASQACHVTQLITEEIIRSGYETHPPPQSYMTYMKWKKNCVKIVLKATESELIKLSKMSNARYIIDDGQTQVAPNSLTVVGFYPSIDMNETLKNYKLL